MLSISQRFTIVTARFLISTCFLHFFRLYLSSGPRRLVLQLHSRPWREWLCSAVACGLVHACLEMGSYSSLPHFSLSFAGCNQIVTPSFPHLICSGHWELWDLFRTDGFLDNSLQCNQVHIAFGCIVLFLLLSFLILSFLFFFFSFFFSPENMVSKRVLSINPDIEGNLLFTNWSSWKFYQTLVFGKLRRLTKGVRCTFFETSQGSQTSIVRQRACLFAV